MSAETLTPTLRLMTATMPPPTIAAAVSFDTDALAELREFYTDVETDGLGPVFDDEPMATQPEPVIDLTVGGFFSEGGDRIVSPTLRVEGSRLLDEAAAWICPRCIEGDGSCRCVYVAPTASKVRKPAAMRTPREITEDTQRVIEQRMAEARR